MTREAALYPLAVAEIFQRMKTCEPSAYRAVMDNVEFGPRAAVALEFAGGAR